MRFVQKGSRILNLRGLCISITDFFVTLMVLNVRLIFDNMFYFVFDFYLLREIDQRICIEFCMKNKIKCEDIFKILTVVYGEATLD